MNHFAFYLFAFSFGAFFVPILSRLIKIPAIIGEILYGMLLAAFFFTESVNLKFINSLAELGFIFLMFLAGLELNFDNINSQRLKRPLLSLLLMLLASSGLWFFGAIDNIFQVLLISTLSVGIVFLGLKFEQDEQTELGQDIIWVASLGELLVIFAMIIIEVAYSHFETANVLKQISGLFIFLLLAYFFLRLIIYFFWRFPKAVFIFGKDKNISELGVRLSFLVLLMMVALSSFLEFEKILGAFLGGMMLSFAVRDKHILEEKLSTIGYGFFTPFFFIKLGWDFDLNSEHLLQIIQQAIILYFLILSVKIVGSLALLKKESNIPWQTKIRQILSASFLWAAPLTLLVALAKLGTEPHLDLINELQYNAIILCAILGAILGPLGYSILRIKEKINL